MGSFKEMYSTEVCVPCSHILANGVIKGVTEGISEQVWEQVNTIKMLYSEIMKKEKEKMRLWEASWIGMQGAGSCPVRWYRT
jgi:hypothetical protein